MKMPGFLVGKGSRLGTRVAFPKARLVILVEVGIHLIFDALMCPYNMGETVRALKLLPSLTQEMLLMWDRGKHSYGMVEATVSKGCDYVEFIPCNVNFLALPNLVCEKVNNFYEN